MDERDVTVDDWKKMDIEEAIALAEKSLKDAEEKSIEYFAMKDEDNAETFNFICAALSGFVAGLKEIRAMKTGK